ncbi:probable protein S-acyltransferase 16 isoform X2 [Malus sylvestris]|uniref:probable protein S-acyltransferase 16 isoform X2 n=1 Tax=Malus sylvestris TaxID=3752 RepID=UPI0021AC2566|nr:probable protein S-acyltransferase 16 isoform X2 [Malus sylvestris]XP_050143218.1 probable protein S-acyltransferase 16 isoform X2 [Malus sylvestris]
MAASVLTLWHPLFSLNQKVLLVGSLTYDPKKEDQETGDSFQTAYVISGLLLVPLCVALSVLLGWHIIYLTLQNKTTIEYHEGVRGMWLAEKGGQIYSHPYDRGGYKNGGTRLDFVIDFVPSLGLFCLQHYDFLRTHSWLCVATSNLSM